MFHVNMLKPYRERPEEVVAICAPEAEDLAGLPLPDVLGERTPSQTWDQVHLGEDLCPRERQQAEELLRQRQRMFSGRPGYTHLAQHKVEIQTPLRQNPFRIPESVREGMRQEIQEMLGLGACAYLDDITIYSATWEEHLNHLETVLDRIHQAGITLNPNKCLVGKAEVRYLGHWVGSGKQRPEPAKIEAIAKWPTPRTKTQVMAFLGTAGYYRKFVPNYSSVAKPLTDLTHKNQPRQVTWTPECEEALCQLKDALTNTPVLAAPNPTKHFLVHTDASMFGLVAVLSQVGPDGQEHPVAYLSRKLLPREVSYAAIEKDCLAVVWALKKLQPYLYGRQFSLLTDHNPLVWLNRVSGDNARLLRWSLALQPLDFTIHYTPGKQKEDMGVWSFIMGAVMLLLILVAIFFLLYCGYIYYMHMKYDHIPGPPRDSFLFGHSPTIIKQMRNNLIVYDTFLEWVERYGPVIRFNGLHNVKVLVVSPEGEFLMSPKYTKDPFYKQIENLFGTRFMGTGLVTDRDYEHWHKQRRIMDPAFSRTYLKGLMGTFNEKAEDLVDKLGDKADGKCHVGMHDMLSRLTLDVIAKVAFGMELNSLDDDQTPFPRAISTVMKGMVETRNPLTMYTPGKQAFIRDVKENIKLLRKTGQECIKRRMKAIQDGEDIPVDILTQILKGAELEDGCSQEDLIDNFVTFFIAGQETTANQLSFVVMELARNPEILARVQAEVDEVFGSKRDIEYEDLGKLQYLSQVLKEALRLYPTAPGTHPES
ncbi:unnamed protein product [Ranitomeya imitator]|uniref:ribonuclease H n=1 Tax=Ranitomeya imitator TaxID=111125 RepID=A0ABN9LHQ1_9NEOB|nr:unnamed protein product [Ranitomeya imitator]